MRPTRSGSTGPPTTPSRAGTTRPWSSPRASPASTSPSLPARIGIFIGTLLVILALAVLPLLSPWFVHTALDTAGSADRLDLPADQAHALSDRSVSELVLGPGDFAFDGPDGRPFYDPDERAHLRDARLLLGLCLAAGGVALLGLAVVLVRRPQRRAATWALIGRAGLIVALAVALLGLLSLVAFDSLFTLFHRLAFPGGNWAFDPQAQRLVQLYPFGFWRIAATALGALMIGLGLGAWLLGRRFGRPPAELPASDPTRPATSG